MADTMPAFEHCFVHVFPPSYTAYYSNVMYDHPIDTDAVASVHAGPRKPPPIDCAAAERSVVKRVRVRVHTSVCVPPPPSPCATPRR